MKAQFGSRAVLFSPEPQSEVAPHLAENLSIPLGSVSLLGDLAIPAGAGGIVIFAHGSGSSRLSPRNQYVARALRDAGSGTLLFDLLTREEETADAESRELRFDIGFLALRLVKVTQWLATLPSARHLPFGYFGASTGAAAAMVAASMIPSRIAAVVSRGGRPDLALDALQRVRAASLLLVGADDHSVLRLNQVAYRELHCERDLRVIPRATHLFQEPGAIEDVAVAAADWFASAWREHR